MYHPQKNVVRSLDDHQKQKQKKINGHCTRLIIFVTDDVKMMQI